MIVHIGHDYILDGNRLVHVQDRDCLNLDAKVGIVDENGLVPDTQWVAWDRLSSPNNAIRLLPFVERLPKGIAR